VSKTLSRGQAVLLGLVVVGIVGLSGYGLSRIAARQGLWGETVDLTVGLPEAHDVTPGTPVRVRGVEAGQVVAVEYPEHDGTDAAVIVRMRVDAKFAGRLYADATAQVHSTGLLGSRVVAISPGSPAAGALADGRLKSAETPDLAKTVARLTEAADKIGAAADETKQLVHDARNGNGSLARLIHDDGLYRDLQWLVKDTRQTVQRADSAVNKVEGQVDNVERFVKDGRETLQATRNTVEGVNQSWVGRQFVEDATKILVRPDCRREARPFDIQHLFEPGTAILTDMGRDHLLAIAQWLKEVPDDRAEVVVVSLCDPNDRTQTSASAGELTRKQSEAVVEFLKAHKVHKTGWVARRKITAIGLGFGPSPVVERVPLPPSHLQVILFTPQA
jgi:ABC-type transporter Mla subunit MlaD